MAESNSGDAVPDPVPDLPPFHALFSQLYSREEVFDLVAEFNTSLHRLPYPQPLIATRPVEQAAIVCRGLTTPSLTTTADATGVTIRVDDDQHPEFWMELRFATEHLGELLARVLVQCGGYTPAALEALREFMQRFPRS